MHKYGLTPKSVTDSRKRFFGTYDTRFNMETLIQYVAKMKRRFGG